ncbi:MAG: hypothetical protein COW18_02330 [Zetaproteobacteria bacterium CG12_big_fil_rev_8_21_14_0_65_54_13]|nr:MAG: hypothetical protein COW18_02330 [Zetaproteobacteria bacterium CG12_big_fil_rev_8_21_14_0_65_54_13]
MGTPESLKPQPADACTPGQCSAWSMDQQIWRLWVVLHFLPVGVTQQQVLRKNEIRKIATVLGSSDHDMITSLITTMQGTGLLARHEGLLQPACINWPAWSKRMRAAIYAAIHGWERWSRAEEHDAMDLLADLPVDCWLNLDEVVEWLRMQSHGKLVGAHWMSLFTDHHALSLHHLSSDRQCIYLLPLWRTVLLEQAVTLPAPGWHGADKDAKSCGFISASGEILLPPDCHHSVLAKLTTCCNITAIEQMITLQLDLKAIQRMGADKTALQATRALLECVQSPLPQAIAYLFDKQLAQQAVASVAATSLVVVLNEPSAIHHLQKTGFPFSQPFSDKPEILLLDTSADALAFIRTCAESGIMLETLIKPVQWISGTASIKAWMEMHADRAGRWLEICYQKARSSKPKQLFACITDDYYGRIEVRPTRRSRQGYLWGSSIIALEPRHLLRLRQLEIDEITETGLDQL